MWEKTMKEKTYCPKIDAICPHKISKTKNTCFIMMAYNQTYSKKIETMLKNATEKILKYKPVLAKNLKHKGSTDMFCTTVCRPIKESTICIADLTYINTNVGFELATAQSLQKPVIITQFDPTKKELTKEELKILNDAKKKGKIQYSEIPNTLPSDVQGMIRIRYSSEVELKRKLKEGFKVE